MMRLISRYWLIVPLLLLAIVARDWVETTPDQTTVEPTLDMSATQSDYYLEQFHTRKFNRLGEVEYEVTGDTLAHYPIDDRSEIMQPSVIFNRDQIQWTIESESGQLTKNPAIFTLAGEVVITRETSESKPVTMRTDELSILTEANEIRTDKPIEIISDNWQLRSVGLQSSLNAGKLNLLSTVTGHYEVAKPE